MWPGPGRLPVAAQRQQAAPTDAPRHAALVGCPQPAVAPRDNLVYAHDDPDSRAVQASRNSPPGVRYPVAHLVGAQ